MAGENDYGVRAEIGYPFDNWQWDGEIPTDLIERLSIQAGKLVLGEMARDARIVLTEDNSIPIIEFYCFDGHVRLTHPLSEAIDQWLASRIGGPDDDIHPEDAKELLTVLERATAKIKAHIRP